MKTIEVFCRYSLRIYWTCSSRTIAKYPIEQPLHSSIFLQTKKLPFNWTSSGIWNWIFPSAAQIHVSSSYSGVQTCNARRYVLVWKSVYSRCSSSSPVSQVLKYVQSPRVERLCATSFLLALGEVRCIEYFVRRGLLPGNRIDWLEQSWWSVLFSGSGYNIGDE